MIKSTLSPEDQYYAHKCYQLGVNRNQIAKDLGRSYCAIDTLVNPESYRKQKAAVKAWQTANYERQLEHNRKYQRTEKGRAANRRYEQSDKGKAKNKRYRATDKGLAVNRIKEQKRRALLLEASFPWCPETEAETAEFIRNCPSGFEVDHIIPLSRGGMHHVDNLQYLTPEENRSKKNKIRSEDVELFCSRLFGPYCS